MCNESLGQCVSIQQCSNAIEFNDGSQMFQVRFGDDEEVDSCHYLETCCDPENIIEVPDLPNVPAPGFEAANHENPTRETKISTSSTSPRTPAPLPGGFNVFGANDDNNNVSAEDATTANGPGSRNQEEADEAFVTQSPAVFSVQETTPTLTLNVSQFYRKFFQNVNKLKFLAGIRLPK